MTLVSVALHASHRRASAARTTRHSMRSACPASASPQDPIEYNTRTHHSNMDVYDRIQAPDMMKNAVIVASFVYHAANRDQMIPRKPLHRAPAENK